MAVGSQVRLEGRGVGFFWEELVLVDLGEAIAVFEGGMVNVLTRRMLLLMGSRV
jgi:hypothetical protein